MSPAGSRMGKYLFVFDDLEDSFPERWRILRPGDPTDVPDIPELTGTVNEAGAPSMRKRLEAEYPRPRYDISTAWANTWSAVRNNHRGMRDHDDGPPGTWAPSQGTRRAASASDSRRVGRWTKTLLGLYLAAAVAGAAFLAHALVVFPPEMPELTFVGEQDLHAEAERLREWVAAEVPFAAEWLAPMGLFDFENGLRGVLTPSSWEQEHVTVAERGERLAEGLARIRADYAEAVSLLGVIFGAGFIFACVGLVRPNLGVAVAVCLMPLFATPVATEPLIGVDNMSLFYLVLPMLIAGGGFFVIEAGRSIGTSIAGPRSDAWVRVWFGVFMIVVGAAGTAFGLLLAVGMNAGVLVVAVGPVIYGVFSVLWGIAGLFKRRGKR